MSSNIVHRYFKKEIDGIKIIVKVNPPHLKGTELSIDKKGNVEKRDLEFDQEIFDDLKVDGFEETGPMEYNLYHSGLV